MNNETTWIRLIAGPVSPRFRLRLSQQVARLCAIVFVIASGVNGTVAAQSAPSMGSLSEFLFEGRDGKWQAAIRDGSFVLSNETDPNDIFYLYTNAGVPGSRKIRVEVKADWGQSSRVGLLYGYHPQGPIYYPLVIEDSGRQISLLRRGASGIEPRASTSSDDGGGSQDWRELVIVERQSEIEWSVDGQTLGSLGNSEMGSGLVGIVAMGTGTFAFRGFEVSTTGASRRQPMRQAQLPVDEIDPAPMAQPMAQPTAQPTAQPAGQPVAQPAANTMAPAARQVQIMDQTWNMPIWREKVPAGWEVFQQIATDVEKGGYTTFLRDLYGPKGELIRDFGSAIHNATLNVSADMIIQQAAASVVEQPKIGQPRPSEMMENLWVVGLKRQGLQARGLTLETFEIPFEGFREGQPVQGTIYLMHTPYHQIGNAGFMEIALVASPPEHFAQTLQINQGVLGSRELSGDYLARKEQHYKEAGERGRVAHQNRMAQLEANHAAHQTRMRGIYAASDRRHEAWMNSNLRTPTTTTSGGGGDYGSHDAYIDQIHERTTLNDPYSGQQINQDGQHDRWFTNGLGDFYGTDDPSFNQHSLQGDWQATEPARSPGW